MAADASEVVVGANGKVWVAATTDTMPTDSDTAMGSVDADWVDLGYVNEDGVTFTDSKEIEAIGAWQSFYATRRIVTGRDAMVSFVLKQWNEKTIPLAFGGGTVSSLGGGEYKYEPPSPEATDERALVIEWTDGDKDYRLLIAKGMVTNAVETNIVRTGSADLPITFAATPNATDDPYTLFTNDPAFA